MFLISGFVTINHIISYPKAFSVFTGGGGNKLYIR